MTTTSSWVILDLAITSVSSAFFLLWDFRLLQDRLGCWCILQVGWGYNLCFFEGIDDDRGWGEIKSSQCFHQYSIRAGICEIKGSMLYPPVHSILAIETLQIEVFSIIICPVISWVTYLEEEGFGVVGMEYINGPVVKISGIAIIEEDLWIELVWSTYSLEMYHCLHPTIPVHIPRRCIAEYPVFFVML